MLEHWIQPHERPGFEKDYLSKDRIGSNLTALTSRQPHSASREVALIGADRRWAKLVRRHLYHFTHRMPEIRLYDLGDLRRTDPDFVTGPMIELISGGITPVIIGANLGMLQALRQAYLHERKTFSPVVVHENVPETLFTHSDKGVVIGVQQHLIPKQLPGHIQFTHLSSTRNAINEAESLIRGSTAFVFDLTAMSMVDLPAQKSFSSSGFCTEEACMLMRFAGLHADTGAVLFTGHDPMSLQLDMSANTMAQLIWYFLEAYNQCIAEDPIHSSHCTTYTVHLDPYDTSFTFYKSERTGRWWVQVHSGNSEPIFPCTYRDYQSATNGQISDRLIFCANNSLESTKQAL